MKKSLAVAATIAGLALTGCAAQPQAPVAPLMASTQPSTDATPPASLGPSGVSPEAEAAFLDGVSAGWDGGALPEDSELLDEALSLCEAEGGSLGPMVDRPFPQWEPALDGLVQWEAAEHLCPRR